MGRTRRIGRRGPNKADEDGWKRMGGQGWADKADKYSNGQGRIRNLANRGIGRTGRLNF